MRKKLLMLCMQSCLLVSLGMNATIVYADEPYLGEVRWFAGNFAPRGWALCDGQLLAISQHDALFSLLGTFYGGDGRTTFGLPDMRGRAMMHSGNGSGLTPRNVGTKSGTETVTVNTSQLPSHTHTLGADSTGGDSVLPNDRVISKAGRLRVYGAAANSDMDTTSITTAGSGQGHNNMQPYIALNCIIALQGVYPSRN